MYKCTECGLEFKNKPEYCDCGNNEFVLTVSDKEKAPKPVVDIDTTQPEPVPETIRAEESSITATREQPTFNNYKIERKPFKMPVSPIALFIFIMCLLLSLLIWVLWNPVKETAEKVSEIIEITETKAIPSIDKLWKNPVPVIKQEDTTVSQNNNTLKQQNTIVAPTKKNTTASKPTTKTTSKQVSKPAVKTTTQTIQSSKAKTTSTPVQTVKPVQQQTAIEEAAKKAQQEKQRAEAEALAAAEKAKKAAQTKQELHSYKINLRNAIGQKIDFTRVLGDGDCAVTFKVDSNGRLINRNFAKQSPNITLNNAVYNAILAVPSYSAPPSGYSNETLRLNVSFKNGNFAITLE